MRTMTSMQPPVASHGNDSLRCCDLAKIGLMFAIAAGFVGQAIVWLTM